MDLDQALAQLTDALARDDRDGEMRGRLALLAIAAIALRDLHRSADALEHIARNLPAK